MKTLHTIMQKSFIGVAVVVLITGCSSMSGKTDTDEKLTVERIDSQHAQITRAEVQQDDTGLKVTGSLQTKLQRRNRIPGHLHVEVLDSDGNLLGRSKTSYRRQHYKSNQSNFSDVLSVAPGKAATVRVIHREASSDYSDKTNPLPATESNVVAGKNLYQQHCASCHGESGEGDGAAGKELTRQPAKVAEFSKMSYASDGYLFWMVFEGGDVLRSEMPSFSHTITDDEIWKIITYLRQL